MLYMYKDHLSMTCFFSFLYGMFGWARSEPMRILKEGMTPYCITALVITETLTQDTIISLKTRVFQNVICKILAILLQPPWFKLYTPELDLGGHGRPAESSLHHRCHFSGWQSQWVVSSWEQQAPWRTPPPDGASLWNQLAWVWRS